jgi:porin
VYPLASPGVRIQFMPTSNFYVMAGVFGQDLNSDPTTNNQNGIRFGLNSNSGMLIMSETGYLVNQSPNDRGLQGTYRLGSFVHTENSRRGPRRRKTPTARAICRAGAPTTASMA